MAPFVGEYLTSYLTTRVMFALYLTISEIFEQNIKIPKVLTLQMKIKVKVYKN